MLLKPLHDFMNFDFDLNLTLRKTEKGFCVSVCPKVNTSTKDQVIKPFIITGDLETIETDLLEHLSKIKEMTHAYVNTMAQYESSLKEASKKAQPPKSKTEISKEEKLKGKESDKHAGILSGQPEDSEDFKKTLQIASVETLKAAYKKCNSSKRKLINKELKALTGKDAEELGLSGQMDLFANISENNQCESHSETSQAE